MSTYYCVKILDDNLIECTTLSQKGTLVSVLGSEHFNTLDTLNLQLKKKKNVNFILFDNHFLKSEIVLDKTISGKSTINSMIFAKLQKEIPEIDALRFKASIGLDNPKKTTTKYSINGVYQNTPIYKLFDKIKSFENTNIVTLPNFSIYEMVRKFYPQGSFISVWCNNDFITVVAGDSYELYYSRNEKIENAQHKDLTKELIKNILYARQKVREIKFDVVFINGSLVENQSLFQEVMMQVKIPVATLIGSTKRLGGIDHLQLNQFFIEISTLFVGYDFDFTSSKIKSFVQFGKIKNYFVILGVILLGYFGFLTYEKFLQYSNQKTQYENILYKISQDTNYLALSNKNKQTIFSLLDQIRTNPNGDFLDQLSFIVGNIYKVNSSNYDIKIQDDLAGFVWEENKISSISFSLKKEFQTLQELNQFQNSIALFQAEFQSGVKLSAKYDMNTKTALLDLKFLGSAK